MSLTATAEEIAAVTEEVRAVMGRLQAEAETIQTLGERLAALREPNLDGPISTATSHFLSVDIGINDCVVDCEEALQHLEGWTPR